MIDTAANSLPQVRTGTIKAFAVTGRQRLARAPDIPTVGEEGLPGLQALNWQAVFLPKGVPTEVIAKLNTAVVAALADASVRRQLADIGQEIFPREQQTPGSSSLLPAGRDREMVANHRSEQKANRGAVKPILVRTPRDALLQNLRVHQKHQNSIFAISDDWRQFDLGRDKSPQVFGGPPATSMPELFGQFLRLSQSKIVDRR